MGCEVPRCADWVHSSRETDIGDESGGIGWQTLEDLGRMRTSLRVPATRRDPRRDDDSCRHAHRGGEVL